MKLDIHYGIRSLTKKEIKSYEDKGLLIKSNPFNSNLVAATDISQRRYLSPDDILYDKYSLSTDSMETIIYFTDDKKPSILPKTFETFTLNFDIDNIKEFELAHGDTYYCRKFVKTEYLKKLYAGMEVIIPDVNDMNYVYFANTLVDSKVIDLPLPICYWTKDGIMCNNSLPFLFIHTSLEFIPVVFVVERDHKLVEDEILPKPFFDEVEIEDISPAVNGFEEMFVKVGEYYRFATNISREEISKTILNLQKFPISKTVEHNLKKYGIIQTAHIFPNMGMTKSRASSNELSYRWFINDERLTSFPIVFLEIKELEDFVKFPKPMEEKMLNCKTIVTPEIQSTEKQIKYSDLFKLLEPVLLDQSVLAEIAKDEKLAPDFCKDFMPIPVDETDERLHLCLLVGFDTINLSILKKYSENDLVPVVIHYYDDIPFLNEEFKKNLLSL